MSSQHPPQAEPLLNPGVHPLGSGAPRLPPSAPLPCKPLSASPPATPHDPCSEFGARTCSSSKSETGTPSPCGGTPARLLQRHVCNPEPAWRPGAGAAFICATGRHVLRMEQAPPPSARACVLREARKQVKKPTWASTLRRGTVVCVAPWAQPHSSLLERPRARRRPVAGSSGAGRPLFPSLNDSPLHLSVLS